MKRRAIIIGAVLLTLGACGGDDSGGAADTSPAATDTSAGELRPAEDVRADEAMSGERHAMGDTVEFGGASITLSAPVVGGDDFGPWLEVTFRAENAGDEPVAPFEVSMLCTGNTEEGGTQMGGTYPWNAELPAQSFDEGTVHILLPGDGRFGEPRQECISPAVVKVDQVGAFIGEQPRELWAIDDALIAEMNADERMPPT